MIHLDTNYLIGLAVPGSHEAAEVDEWLAAGQSLAASAIAWSEVLNGPVTAEEISRVEDVVQANIRPFGSQEAARAAELFNKTGRRRGSRFDCFIAAAAIMDGAEVATVNQEDFKLFAAHGLKLLAAKRPRSDAKQ